jgi:hypothetical protein
MGFSAATALREGSQVGAQSAIRNIAPGQDGRVQIFLTCGLPTSRRAFFVCARRVAADPR